MKVIMEKVDIIVKLKEKIAQAKRDNDALAQPLQKLLDSIVADQRQTPAI